MHSGEVEEALIEVRQKRHLPATVDLPTPPLADETATTFLTSRIFLFSGSPRRRGKDGGVPERGSPYIHFQHMLITLLE